MLRSTGHDGDGEDGLCRECEGAAAVGPCAACEAMICGNCGVMSKDPVGRRVICISCARLVADVGARRLERRPISRQAIAVVVLAAFAVAALTLLLGCVAERVTPAPQPAPVVVAPAPVPVDAGVDAAPAPPPRVLVRSEPPAGSGALPGDPVVAARIFAFSDSQLHYLFGKRTFAQSPFADRMSFEVAVRPAALDIGSDLLLATFLRERQLHYPDHELVFLGDAADVSCTQEIDEFVAVLAEAGIDTLLPVASNHDGFFVGNFTSRADLDGNLRLTDMPHDWTRACAEPGSFSDHRLTKGRAVARLEALLPEGPLWATSSAWRGAEGPTDYASSWLYYVRPLGGGDPGAPPVWGVFLDTVDYRGFDFAASRGAGSVGVVSANQLRFLDLAMFEAAGQSSDKTRFLLFGHHPMSSLDRASRERIRAFLDVRPEILGYVTAHAHVSRERTIQLSGGRSIPELVVGSTTDAPQEARLLEVQIGEHRDALTSWRLRLDPSPLCDDVPALARTDALGYTGYRLRRDDTPDLSVGTLEKLSIGLGLSDLTEKRLIQNLGALLVENELVRAWAHLWTESPAPIETSDRNTIETILDRRYAAGPGVTDLRPYLRGEARPKNLTRYDRWNDPVVSSILAIAAQGVHRFGPLHDLSTRLRSARDTSADARRYFLCHALHAAAAEATTHRVDGDVIYIR